MFVQVGGNWVINSNKVFNFGRHPASPKVLVVEFENGEEEDFNFDNQEERDEAFDTLCSALIGRSFITEG